MRNHLHSWHAYHCRYAVPKVRQSSCEHQTSTRGGSEWSYGSISWGSDGSIWVLAKTRVLENIHFSEVLLPTSQSRCCPDTILRNLCNNHTRGTKWRKLQTNCDKSIHWIPNKVHSETPSGEISKPRSYHAQQFEVFPHLLLISDNSSQLTNDRLNSIFGRTYYLLCPATIHITARIWIPSVK